MTKNKQNTTIIALFISLISLVFILLSSFLNIPFYYLVLVIVFFTITLLKIEYGIYLISFFLPVINWNFIYFGLRIPFIDLLAFSVLFIFLLQHFLARNFKNINLAHVFSFSLFFVVTILSSIFSDNVYSDLWYSVRWILFFYLVYIILPLNIIKSEKVLKNTLLAFSASAVLISLMGLISIFTQDWLGALARVKPLGILGIYPIGQNQNLMVETLLPGIFILIALKYWFRESFQKRLINILILFIGSILILTFSRGAWLSLFVVSFISALIYYRQGILKFLIPLFMIMILMTPVMFYMINLQTTYSIGTGSNNSRLLLTRIAWDSFKKNPILGEGTGEYFNIVAENIRFRVNYWEPVDSHGILQKILAENGSLGIITFMIFVIAIYKKFFSVFRDRTFIDIYLPLIAAASSVFIFELFNTSYYKGKLWFVVALALASVKLIEDKKLNPTAPLYSYQNTSLIRESKIYEK